MARWNRLKNPADTAPGNGNPASFRPGNGLVWFLLTCCAAIGNAVSLPLLFGVDFLFGSIFILLVLCLFGLRAAVATALVAGTVTVLAWNHPFGLLIQVVEILAIGLIYRKLTPNLIVSASLFWFVAGVPAVTAISLWGIQVEWTVAWVLSTKQAVNGVFNAVIASALLVAFPLGQWLGREVNSFHRSLIQAVYTLIAVLTLVPALAVTVLSGHNAMEELETKMEYVLSTNATAFENRFTSWSERRLLAMERLANSLSEMEDDDVATVESEVASLQRLFPDFASVAVADDTGRIVTSFSETEFEPFFSDSESFAKRPLELLREDPRPQFTFDEEVFQHGLQYIAAPLMNGDQVIGAVLGMIQLDHLEGLLGQVSPLDRIVSVLAIGDGHYLRGESTGESWTEKVAGPRSNPIRLRDSSIFLLASESENPPRVREWTEGYYGLELDLSGELPSQLFLHLPVAAFQGQLFSGYSRNLFIALLLVAFSLLVSLIVCRRLSAPITELATITSNLPERIRSGELDLRVTESFPELERLLGNFRSAASALEDSLGQLAHKDEMLEERKKSEAEARQSLYHSRKELRAILENAPDLIASFDAECRYLFVNPQITEMTGMEPPSVIGRTSRELGMPEHLCAFWEKSIREVFESGESSEIRFSYRTERGDRSYQSRLVPERDENGRTASVLSITRDITALRDAQESLNGQVRVLKMVTNAVPLKRILSTVAAMVEECHPRLRAIIFYYREAERRFTLSASPSLSEEVKSSLENHAATLLAVHTEAGGVPFGPPPREHAEAWERFRKLLNDCRLDACLAVPLYSSGKKLIGVLETYWEGIPPKAPVPRESIENAGQVAAIAIEKRQAEEELEEAGRVLRCYAQDLERRVEERTAELEANNRELENFCHSIAHDLRAPLRAIRNYSQMLEANAGQEEENPFPRRIQQTVVKMDTLLEDLLHYSRLSRQEVPIETVPLESVTRNAMDSLATDITEKHADIRLSTPLPSVRANQTILQQVISNLLSNAIKYVPSETRPEVRIFAEKTKNEKVRLCIRDNGIGISPEDTAHIFSAFERLHDSKTYAGTGLGLAIVKRGVERMGGEIAVESEPGKGSLFWIELPVAESPS